MASKLNHYRLWCDTDSQWEYSWGKTAPTTCPTDTAHDIDETKTAVVEAASTEQVNLLDDKGDTVNWPMTEKRTPVLVTNNVVPGYYLYVTGAFDRIREDATHTVAEINADTPSQGDCFKLSDSGQLTAGSLDVVAGDYVEYYAAAWAKVTVPKRGAGLQMAAKQDGPGKVEVRGGFMEHVYVVGGLIADHVNADLRDWIEMEVWFPASSPEDKTATHDGNANKVATPYGFNIIVPAPLGDGDWNVDGETLEVGEINLDLVPVPNTSDPQAGMWNWDPDVSPSITPVANPAAPDGSYDLFDVGMGAQVRQANRVPLRFKGPITPDTLKGKKLLPHWELVFRIARTESAGVVEGAAVMQLNRRKTV